MLELMDWGIVVALIAVFTLIWTAIFTVIVRYLSDLNVSRELGRLDDEVESLKMAELSKKGVSARQEKAERTQGAMIQALTMFKAGKPVEEIVKEVGTAYPDIAMDLMKKGVKI